jgi:hypothetical protein
MKKPHPILVDFETRTGLGPTYAARLLGIPYISYAQYRNHTRPLKQQLVFHMDVLLLLDKRALNERIERLAYGS